MDAETGNPFFAKYGPWAVVVGASEGVGEFAAGLIASHGVNLLLVARNGSRLDAVASGIRVRSDVEVRALTVDLSGPDAAHDILLATEDLAIGLLVYTPGAVHNGDLYLDQPVELPLRMITLNCTVPVVLTHSLAAPMKDRGRGGIVLVGSMGCFAGGPHMVAYSAAKAFQVNLVEGLWAELGRAGVDVLSAVIGSTDTPARTRTLGVQWNEEMDMTSEDVAREIIEHIGNGPTRIIGKLTSGIGPMAKPWSEFRAIAVAATLEATAGFTARTHSGGD
jgi:short-subunit dehydrogenase